MAVAICEIVLLIALLAACFGYHSLFVIRCSLVECFASFAWNTLYRVVPSQYSRMCRAGLVKGCWDNTAQH